MYKTILLSFALLTFFSVQAQSYRKIPSTGARWKMEYGFADGGCIWDYGYFMHTMGDTMVAGRNVTRITITNTVVCNSGNCSPGGIEPLRYIYQDSIGGVFRADTNGTLRPLMDYSLQPGDSLLDTLDPWFQYRYGVDSVDTVTFIDGIPRKRLYVTRSPIFNSIWIEGMGDQYRGLFPDPLFESWSYVLCYKEDSVKLHDGSPTNLWGCGNDCDVFNAISDANETRLRIVPNPSNGAWRLDGIPISHISLHDISGKFIWEKSFEANAVVEIDPGPTLPNGLYFAQARTMNGEAIVLKLIRE